MKGAYTLAIQATLRDTDALGHVNNAVYVNWFEEVRTAYVCDRRGLTTLDQVDFILASTTAHFRSPVFMLEMIDMRCAPVRLGRSSWDLAYEGRARSDGRLVVEGTSTQVQYDYATRASTPIPPAWRAVLEADLETR
ncbi:MAG TPA: thioesterase family protein [Candidatus Polarisedimenticolaceae bacterium]|nr:thioesterase family protein [Candidatus Polarisedimenticolaceae bacterium]